METIDLNALKNRAYKNACEHGFHDVEWSNEHFLMLIITELSEAVQADRKGDYCSNKISSTERYNLFPTEESRFKKEFNAFIKDTVEDELADVVIRCLDLAGLRGLETCISDAEIADACASCTEESFTKSVYGIVDAIIYIRSYNGENSRLGFCVRNCLINVYGLAKHIGIDLDWQIEQKMKYNELRPAMHGKRY